MTLSTYMPPLGLCSTFLTTPLLPRPITATSCKSSRAMPDWLLACLLLLLLGLLLDELLPVPASATLLLAGVDAALRHCASASKPAAAAAAAAVVAGVLHAPALAAAFAAGVEVREAGLEELLQLPSGCLRGISAAAVLTLRHCSGKVWMPLRGMRGCFLMPITCIACSAWLAQVNI
jgi:hypothetical protein